MVKNDYIGWLVIFGVIVLLLEIVFFNPGLIFSLVISGGMIYLGRKKPRRTFKKILFYGGIFFFGISILNMMTFKFLLLAILLHFFIQFLNSKKQPKQISPKLVEPVEPKHSEDVISTKPLLENVFLGQQKTPEGVYEWNDINIQTGIGDTVIDLSYTMLPKGETVIFIRNVIGNARILIPYEIEVNIHHSCIVGAATFFEKKKAKVFNQVLNLKTPGYDKADQKVKIFTSLVVGNIEVSRI